MQLYLWRWGMTPQKPLLRARERSPAAIKAWLGQDYPAIAARAKREGAVIWWGDETGVSNVDQTGRAWVPRGQTPVVTRHARRLGGSMISAVSNRGLMRFMLYDDALNAGLFLTFLRRPVKGTKGKVFLIVDNLRVHRARKVKAWTAAHQHEIELFHLPAYAPEHAPDEHLDNDLEHPTVLRAVLRHIIEHADWNGIDVYGRPVPRFEVACEHWLPDKLAAFAAGDEDLEEEDPAEEDDPEEDADAVLA